MTFAQTLFAALMGGVLAILGGFATHTWQALLKRNSLATAFRGEIYAIVENAKRRGYVEHYKSYLNIWKQGKTLGSRPSMFGINELTPENSAPIFYANLGDVGCLEARNCRDVVRFYSIFSGINQDIKAISLDMSIQATDLVALIEEDLKLWDEALQIAEDLENRLVDIGFVEWFILTKHLARWWNQKICENRIY